MNNQTDTPHRRLLDLYILSFETWPAEQCHCCLHGVPNKSCLQTKEISPIHR